MQNKPKNKNTSVINDPKFQKWVRNFDFRDPKFLAEVDKRSKTSETYIDNLRRAQKIAERKSDAQRWIPIRNKRERV